MNTNMSTLYHSKHAGPSNINSSNTEQAAVEQSTTDIQNIAIDTNPAPMPTNSTDTIPTSKPSYAEQARKQPATRPKYAPGQYRSHQPTLANLELASKVFNSSQQPPTADYKYLYFPSNKRLKPSVIRSRLTLLGVDNVRILDAHCPDWN
ncbi:hypothetical protein, partial, partial [Parasitella parasitica]